MDFDRLNAFFAGLNFSELLLKIAGIALTVIVILAVFNILQYILGRLLKGKVSDQRNYIVTKAVRYAGFVLAALFLFNRIGVDTSAILGAAGIAGIALGFAAQTSVSNFISGFFLLSEKSFAVGDTIKVDDTSGVVLSVDSLSVKLRTFDNLFIRIPNETIIKSCVTNITRFPIRRLDLSFDIAYREDPENVRRILLELAEKNPYSLENPPPFFGINTLGSSGIGILFNLWFEKSNYWNLKNSILLDIKRAFEEQHIEIPREKIDITIGEQHGA